MFTRSHIAKRAVSQIRCKLESLLLQMLTASDIWSIE